MFARESRSFFLTGHRTRPNRKCIDFNTHGDIMIDRQRLLLYILTPILAGSLLIGSASASHKKKKKTDTTTTQTTDASKTTTQKPSTQTRTVANSTVSASEIANAKSKGLVWVNTESKVYHTGGKYYGNTKHGKFMSKADAEKAGYKASKR